ncbi:MAG TPA: ATP-binding protein [Stenomitos sp.]
MTDRPPSSNAEIDRLSAIIATQQAIAVQGQDFDAVMRLITERSQTLTRADGAVIELAEGDEMVYRYASGTAEASLGMRLNRDGSISGLSIMTGEILLCHDSEVDDRVDREACRRVGCRSLIVVPLRHEQTLVGVLKVMAGTSAAFDAHDLNTLQLMAGFIGTAMHRAQTARLQQSLLQQLRTQQDLMQRIIDHTPLAMAFIDCELTYRWNNPAHSRLIGAPSERLIGRSIAEQQPTLPAQFGDIYRRVLESSETVVLEDQPVILTYDGIPTQRYVDLSYVPTRDAQGDLEGFIALAADVTERVERERFQAERIAALQESDRLKDQFISMVSHELRTPLTSLRGSLGLLASGRMGTLPDQGQQMIQMAHNNCERLMRLVNDILDIAQIQAGKFRIQTEACDARTLAQEAVEAMQGMANKAKVRLVTKAPSLPLRADPGRIIQALSNLLSNAIKFSPVEALIQVTLTRVDQGVRFVVTDQGPGIPADQQDLIFERFEQVDSSDTRARGGTGLGLPICRSIIRAHGGQIGVENLPEGGSAFWFTLPAADAA